MERPAHPMSVPVLVTTHHQNGTWNHFAWSSNQYDLNANGDHVGHQIAHVVQQQGHPLEHPSYQNFLQVVTNHVQNHLEQFGDIEHTHTDFHVQTPVGNRGPTAYFSISNDHVTSPVFFTLNAMANHVTNHPSHNTVYICQHLFL